MGGFLGFLGSAFSSILGGGVGILAAIGMGIAAAMMQPNVYGPKLKNKSIASSTYGHPIPRCRGTVRLQGQLIFWNKIQETTHARHVGGFFFGLIGGSSVYSYTYSTRCAFAFGKKLGGGQATKFIRIWADGKLLYSTLVSDAALSGTVTVVGTVPAGTQAVPVQISGGGSLVLSAGDLIHFSSEPNTDYEVQQDVNLGSGATGFVDVYPPLSNDLTGDTISIPGLAAPLVDLSSFDANPHDGSHVVANPVPNGTIRFHLGTATELPDPAMVTQFGAGQVPGYRGLPYVMLDWLELANYGNHVPSISAEIAFDAASGQYPSVPIPNTTLLPGGGGPTHFLIPTLQASALTFLNPANILPYVWAISGVLPNLTLYKISTQTNQVVSSVAVNTTGGLCSPMVVDSQGFIYFVSGGYTLFKWDGQGMQLAQSASIWIMSRNLQVWDFLASAFGNPVLMKFLATVGSFGGMVVWDRTTLCPLGTENLTSTTPVIDKYSISGAPHLTLGDPSIISAAYDGSGDMVADAKGNLWRACGAWLTMYNCQPQSSIDISQLPNIVPILALPSFAGTAVDVSSITGGSGHSSTLLYDPVDNAIIVLGENGLCKVSCDTFQIIATNLASHPWSSGAVSATGDVADGLSTFIVTGSITSLVWRYSTATLELLDTYTMSNWAGGSGTFALAYDGLGDSLWGDTSGTAYRLYLDRGNGGGVGLDVIVASVFAEAGYDPSEYDVTALSSISTGGYEIDQEPYLDSIKKLQQLFLFDMAEIDGVIVCVPRSAGAGVFTITDDDFGATDIGRAPAARVIETLQQETDVPETVWVHYYDKTKQLQQATQYDKRISQPYASALVAKPKVTNSRNQLVISTPVTDSPGPMKLQARRSLLDHWQARMRIQFKTGIKWIRLDPTDKGQLSYKGKTFDIRLTAVDRGAGLALDFQGESYDSGVYSVPAVVNQPGSSSSSSLPVPVPSLTCSSNYTIVPTYPLSQTSTTNLALAATAATFDTGLRTQYNARPTLTIADPGSGLTQIYYVTIYDPNCTGEVPGVNSLTVFCETTAAAAHVGEDHYINMGSIIAAGAGAIGGNGGAAGQPYPPNGVLVAEIPFGPTTRGPFQVALGNVLTALNLGPIPSDVQIQINVAAGADMGSVEFQALRYDADYIYLIASEDGLIGFLEIFA